MRMKVSMKVNYNNLSQIKAKLPKEVSKVVRKGTLDVASHAAANTPVDTGYLKNSQEIEFKDGGMQGRVSWGADYAVYVHEGTYRQSAQPFARDAFEKVAPSIIDALKQLESKLT